jgi:hypothetical protein
MDAGMDWSLGTQALATRAKALLPHYTFRESKEGRQTQVGAQQLQTHALRQADDLIHHARACIEMAAARTWVIVHAQKPNVLREGIWIAAQYLPVGGGGDVRDRVLGTPLNKVNIKLKKGKLERAHTMVMVPEADPLFVVGRSTAS